MIGRLPMAAILAGLLASAAMADEPAPAASPYFASARDTLMKWLADAQADANVRNQARQLWSDQHAWQPDLMSRVAATLAIVDPRARAVATQCGQPRPLKPAPKFDWLFDKATPALLAHNLRLCYGRYLAQESLFEEASEQLAGLEPTDVLDPSCLLFYQGVVYSQLLDRRQGIKALDRLLDEPEKSPKRYVALARLMREDLKSLEDDTLDHIARRMDDVHRRLELGRGGPKVRKVQDGVIESLDKLIKQIEDQQRQQDQSASAGSTQSSRPADESRIMGGKGPGEVTQKNIGSKSGWGNLPPKQRDEAMQQIGRDFPSHYREVIEQYFKKLAGEGAK